MGYFTKRNMVIVALFQVGVIVAGVLAAGATHKWHTTFNARLPQATTVLAEYGFVALVLPVAWVTAALTLPRRSEDPGAAAVVAFASGIVVLLVLLVVVGHAAIRPWLRLVGW
jgi:uncharacterized membrane protein YdcZ (DUF606 family)